MVKAIWGQLYSFFNLFLLLIKRTQLLWEIIGLQNMQSCGLTYSPLQWDDSDACDINIDRNTWKHEWKGDRERFSQAISDCRVGCRGGDAGKRHTEQPDSRGSLKDCKAISLFGNTVVSVCGLELTPEQLSHAKCSAITGFCSWSKTSLLLRFVETRLRNGNKKLSLITLYEHSVATSLRQKD